MLSLKRIWSRYWKAYLAQPLRYLTKLNSEKKTDSLKELESWYEKCWWGGREYNREECEGIYALSEKSNIRTDNFFRPVSLDSFASLNLTSEIKTGSGQTTLLYPLDIRRISAIRIRGCWLWLVYDPLILGSNMFCIPWSRKFGKYLASWSAGSGTWK